MYLYYRFQEAGYKVDVVGPKAKEIYTDEHGLTIKSDLSPQDADIKDQVAVTIPWRPGSRLHENKEGSG